MKTYEIKIRIPMWLARPFQDASYFFRKWKYWASPDRCAACNTRMYVRSYEIEHYFPNGQRLMVGNHNTIKDTNGKYVTVCRECIASRLESQEWQPRFHHFHLELDGKPSRYPYKYWSAKKCDVTGEKVRSYKDVEIYPYVSMTFCTYAWNAGHVSKQAVIDCVRNGKIKTSMWGLRGPMNHKGLFIDQKGKLL